MKVTEYSKEKDGTIVIDSKSYYDDLSFHIIENEKVLESSFYTLKKDVEEALKHVINDGSPKIVLTIETKKGQVKINKRWVEFKKDYPRR